MKEATRLEEAMVYLATEGSRSPVFGVTKLYKSLFLADVLAKSTLGETITRWRYLRFRNGPVPVDAHKIVDEGGLLSVLEVPIYGRSLKRVVAHRDPDLSVFTDEEVNLLQMSLGIVVGLTAEQASELSHALPAWRWTEPDKLIDDELLKFPYLVHVTRLEGSSMQAVLDSASEQGVI